ncbi:hypothetical protein QFC22_000858 [Naganishia vaughanmartiniae]|uniref:Uncharacterized protein n=1 Tax=Naganishia vaughanmartiniae TaxID=1424756 RepID=A0ACC2XL04_9TREE|nr:hypothetical protein QFC22_000858 [Naganishia vaughanmartiniae]
MIPTDLAWAAPAKPFNLSHNQIKTRCWQLRTGIDKDLAVLSSTALKDQVESLMREMLKVVVEARDAIHVDTTGMGQADKMAAAMTLTSPATCGSMLQRSALRGLGKDLGAHDLLGDRHPAAQHGETLSNFVFSVIKIPTMRSFSDRWFLYGPVIVGLAEKTAALLKLSETLVHCTWYGARSSVVTASAENSIQWIKRICPSPGYFDWEKALLVPGSLSNRFHCPSTATAR